MKTIVILFILCQVNISTTTSCIILTADLLIIIGNIGLLTKSTRDCRHRFCFTFYKWFEYFPVDVVLYDTQCQDVYLYVIIIFLTRWLMIML